MSFMTINLMPLIHHYRVFRDRSEAWRGIRVLTAIFAAIGAATWMLHALEMSLASSLAASLSAAGACGLVAAIRAPRAALRQILRLILGIWFRIDVEGREHLGMAGPMIFAPNHQSLLDGPMLFSLIHRRTAFAMTGKWAEKPLLKFLARWVPIARMDPESPISAKTLVREIEAGNACVIFPEGRLTANGALMKVYGGVSWIIDRSGAKVIPVHFDGLEFAKQSRKKIGFPRLIAPKVRITIGQPRDLGVNPELRGRARREEGVILLGEILEEQRFRALDREQSIPQAMAEAASLFGPGREIIADAMGVSLTYRKIMLGGDILARVLRKRIGAWGSDRGGDRIGILLPNSAGITVVLNALWRLGKVPAMLNPSLGLGPARQCLEVAGIKQVLTSRAMVEKAKLQPMVEAFIAAGVGILWVEDIRAEIGWMQKLAGLFSVRCGKARRGAAMGKSMPGWMWNVAPAVILFTSGSEGAPKGVLLTHRNILANVAQLRARTDIGPADRIFSALPLFHSLGLTGGLILPLMTGCHIFAYPSPLHVRQVPEAAYIHQSTIILGTDTFLGNWGRRAAPADFASIRVAIAGAEAVRQATRDLWASRFGARILEGYGATECAPVLALNTPIRAKDGTVGWLMPGMEMRLEQVPGMPGAKLHVRGPNVTQSYVTPNGEVSAVKYMEGGMWYDTGDAVEVDAQGFIRIVGRIKRFAKIGGEMISLAAVEVLAQKTWPGMACAAIAVPDAKKGNRIILALAPENGHAPSRAELQAKAREEGVSEIMLPAALEIMGDIPLLASGKTDYPQIQRRIEEKIVA